jgi:hypothetical protein
LRRWHKIKVVGAWTNGRVMAAQVGPKAGVISGAASRGVLAYVSGDERGRIVEGSAMPGTCVDTGRVAGRRTVRLRTLDDLQAEVDRITAADAAGRLRTLGNWSAAQILWHVGRLIELSIDGFPFRYRRGPEWITRLFRLLAWRWLIALAFRPGFVNPPEAATLEPDPAVTLDAAGAYLKHQLARIRNGERMTQECSVEGVYSHEQWVYIHLRHAELHLSFLTEQEK